MTYFGGVRGFICPGSKCKMAPVSPAARWQTRGLGTRGEEVSLVGLKNKNGKRRTWRPNHAQAFAGSVREGQGFAFRRKLKIQQNYKKLLWKENKTRTSRESQFSDQYPDHLKHLYLAEEERLKKQLKKADQPLSEEKVNQPFLEEQCTVDGVLCEDQDHLPQPEKWCSNAVSPNTVPKKKKKKTSSQKAQEEYEQVQAKRAAKKQEFERRKQEREEAQKLYKKKKMEMFKILSK
ncbi:thyroid transcription factor 1-associated protein 26, partial [Octodon degus]|uniref:Thyroid transcription factor 1-associated protein 26 n=1 Tax=Octodon degus TaxID=10160 RepID=A0A6P3EJ55_OCTDE